MLIVLKYLVNVLRGYLPVV